MIYDVFHLCISLLFAFCNMFFTKPNQETRVTNKKKRNLLIYLIGHCVYTNHGCACILIILSKRSKFIQYSDFTEILFIIKNIFYYNNKAEQLKRLYYFFLKNWIFTVYKKMRYWSYDLQSYRLIINHNGIICKQLSLLN